mmetsp:Transcript_31347/g.100005  ORF Transcript_31347/g.100005 Transcript_31347/m.100005 type:complete len:230 (+) Transcript_31347:154-843(+)
MSAPPLLAFAVLGLLAGMGAAETAVIRSIRTSNNNGLRGSVAGGTKLYLIGMGLGDDSSGMAVLLKNDKHTKACLIIPYYSNSGTQVVCETEPLLDGEDPEEFIDMVIELWMTPTDMVTLDSAKFSYHINNTPRVDNRLGGQQVSPAVPRRRRGTRVLQRIGHHRQPLRGGSGLPSLLPGQEPALQSEPQGRALHVRPAPQDRQAVGGRGLCGRRCAPHPHGPRLWAER